ncbi:YbaB/EbfC family nucleoid-associated protein [Micromonospora sp. WMMD1120]|uniref:YbaB/EbfC family nucleoid-associated protein n=1 Tax=Micromonospora sp. WMMD1120 TaxID=3016106 RepID=UPI002415BC47|nr:YbaB/EbfC family nucleoid-associated protein [Micromonospora sp. WMMD1120]MDG4806717.1 YbaB/EbfC family nucleoid-associated protein [Micromonospora sp. WMMD1120]
MTAEVPHAGGLLDPGGAMDRLAEWKGRLDQLATATDAMSDRMRDLRVTVADGNGLAEVTVDSTGALVDLQLGQRIQRVAPDVVARTIMSTIALAKRQLADRAQEIIGDTLGPDSPTGQAMAERIGQRLRDDPAVGGPDEQPGRW